MSQQDLFITEIEEQPRVARAAANGLRSQIEALAHVRHLVRERGAAPLVLTGMGSSFDALDGLASLLAAHGIGAIVANTAELLHHRLPLLVPGSVVLAVSQSGSSAELARLLDALAERPHVHLVVVTNTPGTRAGALAAVALAMNAGPEQGPATKSAVASLVVLRAILTLLTTDAPPADVVAATVGEADGLAWAIAGLLDRRESILASLHRWRGRTPAVFVLGRGCAVVTAEISTLVLKEAARVAASGMDAAEFRHGPLELAGPELSAAVVSLDPAARERDARLLRDLAAPGSRVLQIRSETVTMAAPRTQALSANGSAPARGDEPPWPVVEIPGAPPLLDSAVALVPFQLLAWSLATRLSDTPGRFAVGAKITTTE